MEPTRRQAAVDTGINALGLNLWPPLVGIMLCPHSSENYSNKNDTKDPIINAPLWVFRLPSMAQKSNANEGITKSRAALTVPAVSSVSPAIRPDHQVSRRSDHGFDWAYKVGLQSTGRMTWSRLRFKCRWSWFKHGYDDHGIKVDLFQCI